VLESLIERGVLTLVTTHHSVLKLFASQKNGAVNAAMEFDPLTLQPTYRLIPGRPGRSYGLDMAERLGIPEQVIARARARISDDDIRLETLLRQVEYDSARLTAEREQITRKQAALDRERAEADSLLRSAKEDARAIRIKTREEGQHVLASLRLKLRELSRTAAHEQGDVKNSAREVESLAFQLPQVEPREPPSLIGFGAALRRGDQVRLTRANKTGLVLGVRRGKLEIEVDGKKITFSSSEVAPLEPISEKRLNEHASGWNFERQNDEGPSDRVNLLGLRVDESLAEVDRGIDRAGVAGLSVVTIIHGLGTGALKTAVADFLKSHPLVAATRPGTPSEGGAGVTVVELRK
jgi:DNA mismatch repair protein MutS2